MSDTYHRQVILASRPQGIPQAGHFSIVRSPPGFRRSPVALHT